MTDVKKTAPADQREYAASGDASNFAATFVEELVIPSDVILKNQAGGEYEVYQRLKRDDQVKSCWQQRQSAATKCEWFVEAGGDSALDQKAADFIREEMKAIRFDRVSEKMQNAAFYGFAVAECLYRADQGQIHFDAIKVKNIRRFKFRRDGQLVLITKDAPKGVALPDCKFWVLSMGGDDDDDPYGLGLAHALYWPVWLKRNAVKFWAIYLEKYAIPTVWSNTQPGATDDDVDKLLATLAAMNGDSAVVLPAGVTPAILDAVKSSGGDYSTFVDKMDAAISKIILSQTMTTDNGSSRSQAQVHDGVKNDVIKTDNDLLCDSFNDGPVRWIVEWNFPGAAIPRVWRDDSDGEDLDKRAERDKKLHETGWGLDQEAVERVYGPGYVPVQAAGQAVAKVDPAQTDTAFAEADPIMPDAIDRSWQSYLDDQWEEVTTPLVDPIQKLADECQGYDEFLRRLPELIDSQDATALAEVLARLTFQTRAAANGGGDIG
ncbi:MAG: DUF935 family protein [Alphaproteobacteria bacterium]|nr:DUF935 family protein [Alphaproteobacteria bacterium]